MKLYIKNTEIQAQQENDIYHIGFNNIRFDCKPLSWGQKNTIEDSATTYCNVSNSYYIDTLKYHEKMMKICISNLYKSEQIITLQDLLANEGDIVFEVCLWVNEQPSTDLTDYTLEKMEQYHLVKAGSLEAQIKKWTFGQKLEATKSSSIFNPQSQQMSVRNGIFHLKFVTQCLDRLLWKQQQIEINVENIAALPVDVGDFLLKIIAQVNS